MATLYIARARSTSPNIPSKSAYCHERNFRKLLITTERQKPQCLNYSTNFLLYLYPCRAVCWIELQKLPIQHAAPFKFSELNFKLNVASK